MLPLGDNNPTRRLAIINISLITANVLAYVYQTFYTPLGAAEFIRRFGFIP